MDKLQAVKGMNDVLPPASAKWLHVERLARRIAEAHGYREVRPPIVEPTALFARSIGEATDVVEKEMYTFDDRDGKSLTLRPEGTAGAVRAFVEHAVAGTSPVTRWYYVGPMFRHERAQRGRYRQFYQFGIECYGVAEASVEAEQIAILHQLFTELGIAGLDVIVNSVGGPEDRAAYKVALVAWLTPKKDQLCTDCQRRLGTNPLRVLDCKNPSCQALVVDAPPIADSLGDAAKAHFAGCRAALEALGVPHRTDPKLVRGLDYYTGTTFELKASGGDLGAQNTIAGGGRYDGLLRELGGPDVPAVGWAFGLERVVLSMPGEDASFEPKLDVFVIALGEQPRLRALTLAKELRAAGLAVDLEHRVASMKAQMKRADKSGAHHVIVVGDDELTKGVAQVRDMRASTQREVALGELAAALR